MLLVANNVIYFSKIMFISFHVRFFAGAIKKLTNYCTMFNLIK